jgi:hypothetical protein
MHPDIKEFWMDAGYRIIDEDIYFRRFIANKSWINWLLIDSNNKYITIVAMIHEDVPEASTYFFQGKCYFESEMLKIIQLKAFL